MNSAVIIEPRKIRQTVDVIHHFYKKIKNMYFYLFCGKNTKSWWLSKLKIPIQIIELDTDNLTSFEYNDLLKTQTFWNTFVGEYVLIFQSDTWLNDTSIYSFEYFLENNYSYIEMGYKLFCTKN